MRNKNLIFIGFIGLGAVEMGGSQLPGPNLITSVTRYNRGEPLQDKVLILSGQFLGFVLKFLTSYDPFTLAS